jgi:hypothetical protein
VPVVEVPQADDAVLAAANNGLRIGAEADGSDPVHAGVKLGRRLEGRSVPDPHDSVLAGGSDVSAVTGERHGANARSAGLQRFQAPQPLVGAPEANSLVA